MSDTPSQAPAADFDRRIAQHLRALRVERGWSLDNLAQRSGVSRATLSRLENADVSATASVLGRLSAAYGMTASRLLRMVEDDVAALVPRTGQSVWTDPETGFERRSVSPPSAAFAGEVIEGRIPPRVRIAYEHPPRPGLEHHIVLLDGALTVTVDGSRHTLAPGDCLRYRLHGASLFETDPDRAAHYLIFMV